MAGTRLLLTLLVFQIALNLSLGADKPSSSCSAARWLRHEQLPPGLVTAPPPP